MLAAHYAPLARRRRGRHPGRGRDSRSAPPLPARSRLLAPAGVATPPGVVRLAAPPDAEAYARTLYAALRAADEQGLGRVVAVPPEGGALADAVLDRLRRAAVGSSRHRPFG